MEIVLMLVSLVFLCIWTFEYLVMLAARIIIAVCRLVSWATGEAPEERSQSDRYGFNLN
jgi:hypothetical protein